MGVLVGGKPWLRIATYVYSCDLYTMPAILRSHDTAYSSVHNAISILIFFWAVVLRDGENSNMVFGPLRHSQFCYLFFREVM